MGYSINNYLCQLRGVFFVKKQINCKGNQSGFDRFIGSLLIISISPLVFLLLAHVLSYILDKF